MFKKGAEIKPLALVRINSVQKSWASRLWFPTLSLLFLLTPRFCSLKLLIFLLWQDAYFCNTIKLGYAPKIISSSHWIFEFELGAPTDLELEEIETKTLVKLNLYDIYGRLYEETVNIDATTTGPQKVLIDFEGMFLKQKYSEILTKGKWYWESEDIRSTLPLDQSNLDQGQNVFENL